jgi:hypothetical protein
MYLQQLQPVILLLRFVADSDFSSGCYATTTKRNTKGLSLDAKAISRKKYRSQQAGSV